MRPALLDKLDLLGAIKAEAAELEHRAGIRCRVNTRLDRIALAPNQPATVVKIVQEALANVNQHAHATRATVTLSRSAESLTVTIADNGHGISERELASPRSLGLIGMRERSALLGGHLDVSRRRPRGTVVKLTMPVVAAPPASRLAR